MSNIVKTTRGTPGKTFGSQTNADSTAIRQTEDSRPVRSGAEKAAMIKDKMADIAREQIDGTARPRPRG
jgi:hypothetical protein